MKETKEPNEKKLIENGKNVKLFPRLNVYVLGI